MVHRTGETVEDIVLCSKCKHSIVLEQPQTASEELYTLSRNNTALPYSAPVFLTDGYMKILDDEIVNLEETLARLKLIQEEYRLEKRIRLSLSTPIRTLPDELLCEIFAYCCVPRGDKRPNEFKSRGFLQTLALSHVSHHWRSVVVSSSTLWTDISLYLPVDEYNPTRELLELYLSRSGIALLDICLCHFFGDSMPFSFPEDKDDASRQLRLLACHQSRWRSLTLEYALLGCLEEQCSVPSLVELTITKEDEHTDYSLPIENFNDLLSLRRVNMAVDLEKLKIPWNQITDLELPGGCFGDLQMVAEFGKSITSITFTRLSPLSSGDLTDLTLSSLETLNLREIFLDPVGKRKLEGILSRTACPRLSQLSMRSPTEYEETRRWPLESSKIFLSSSPLLSVLKLEGLRLDSSFLIECFPYLQNVTQLNILDCLKVSEGKAEAPLIEEAVDDRLFRSLLFRTADRKDPNSSASQELLPSLQTLHIRGKDLDLNSSFVDFVGSRRVASTAVAQLMEVKLDFEDMVFTFSIEDRLSLKDLCRDGVKIFDCGYMLDGGYKRPFSPPRTWLA